MHLAYYNDNLTMEEEMVSVRLIGDFGEGGGNR